MIMSKKTKFLLGLGTGIGLGILFAPKSGDETRKELKKKCNELLSKVKELDTEEVKENITEKLMELQNELKELDKEKIKEIAIEKAEAIKNKADELVKAAVEKGTPAVQKAAKEVKAATATTLKKLANKLSELICDNSIVIYESFGLNNLHPNTQNIFHPQKHAGQHNLVEFPPDYNSHQEQHIALWYDLYSFPTKNLLLNFLLLHQIQTYISL